MPRFDTHNKKDGQPKKCKFCGEHVWWDWMEGRWYNPGGEQLHVETCQRSQEHYHNEAMTNAETKRSKT